MRSLLALVAALGLLAPSAAWAAQPFKLIRADETYAYLKPEPDRRGLDPLRYIPLGETAYLSLGGEARLRVDTIDAPRFGVGGARADTFALTRLLLSADLHINPKVRIYGQLGLHHDLDKKEPPGASDRDDLDAQVLFVDLAPAENWRLRLGRQELSFNPAQRFVSVREGPNIRQSFDGARLSFGRGKLQADAIFVHPVAIEHGAFDDGGDRDQRFWGLYASAPIARNVSLDLYALNLDRDHARFGAVTGDERRRSMGARLSGKLGAVDYEAEGMLQRGRFAGRDIRAWGGSVGAGYTFGSPWAPRLGIRHDAGSGDKDPADDRLGTFNPLFPRGAYFNQASLVSWSNLSAWRASLGARPSKSLSFEISRTERRRRSGRDAVYLQPMAVLAGSAASPAREVSDDWQVDLGWEINRNLRVQLQAVHVKAAAAVKAVGGRDVDFGLATVQFRF